MAVKVRNGGSMTKERETRAALARLVKAGFIGRGQRDALLFACSGEEREYFYGLIGRWAAAIATMPATYATRWKSDTAVVHLHYFIGGCDWFITERDREAEQLQAFGLADLGYGGELGYIGLGEITAAGAELDLYWTPKTLAEVKKGRG